MAPFRKGQVLARTNFPLYTVRVLTDRHILVAGGGGQAKTGIPNVIEIYELINCGTTCRAEPVTHYQTGNKAIMNCSVFHNGKYYVLAAGMEGMSQIYHLKYKLLENGSANSSDSIEKDGVRQRHKSPQENSHKDGTNSFEQGDGKKTDLNKNGVCTKIGFEVRPDLCFQTDFCTKDDPYQKKVCVSKNKKLIATAGADGFIRLWKYPQFELHQEIQAHTDEVDDIDIHPSCEKIVSISRDGHGYVWNISDGSKFYELQCTLPCKPEEKYLFRACKFGVLDKDESKTCLFIALNPVKKKDPLPSYISKWNGNDFTPLKLMSTGNDVLLAMDVSDDGRFLGLGTLSGSVSIYIAFSLQKLYNVSAAHKIFVTDVAFLRSSEETKRITGDKDTSLISISVDNHIVVHNISRPATMSLSSFIYLFAAIIFIVYFIMDYFNL